MKAIKNVLFVSAFLCATIAYSQYTEVINSNRPGVSKSAFAVGTNVVQFELGPYMLNENHALRNTEDKSFGADFSVRYGLLWPQLEINVEGIYQYTKRTYKNVLTPFDETYGNFKSLTLGAKYLVYDPYKKAGEAKPNLYSWKANHSFKWKDLIPAVSVYAGVHYDTKDNPFTAPEIEGISPKVMIATQNNFASGWVFVTNFMMERIGTEQSDFSYILTLTKSISDQWVLFGETQGISSDFYADNLIRFGGAYLWSRNFQLDTALTFNTKDTPTVFGLTLGASYRLDFHEDKKIDNGTTAKDELERQENAKGNNRKQRKKREKETETNFEDVD